MVNKKLTITVSDEAYRYYNSLAKECDISMSKLFHRAGSIVSKEDLINFPNKYEYKGGVPSPNEQSKG